jgi:hypothetical protein
LYQRQLLTHAATTLQSVAEGDDCSSASSSSPRLSLLLGERTVTPPIKDASASPEEQFDASVQAKENCDCSPEDRWMHWISTGLLLTVTYVTAISVPGVAAVWSIFGSSMALFIAFVVPTACYLQILKHKGLTVQSLFAWVLLIASLAAMVLCTRQAVSNAINGSL